jgi:SAM-dependent methyltransferase
MPSPTHPSEPRDAGADASVPPSGPRRGPYVLWNLYARLYDSIAELLPYQEMLDEVVASLDLAPGMRVLDAGCGTGALAERLLDRYPDIAYVGVDLARAMLAHARARRRWPAGFTFVEGNVDDLLAGDSSGFDRIVSVNVLWTLPDPRATLARMSAGLRPGGLMVHTTPRLMFRAYVIVWRHLAGQRGGRRLRALLRLPRLCLAGLVNLLLVAQSAIRARAPRARQRWHQEGLVALLQDAGTAPYPVRPCYAGQGHLLVARRRQ